MAGEEGREEKEEARSLKRGQESRKIWWVAGCLGCVGIILAFSILFSSCFAVPLFFGYLFSERPSLKVSCENVSTFAGESFEFEIEIKNVGRSKVRVNQVDFEESEIEKKFTLTEIDPPASGEEFMESFEGMPPSMTFYYEPPIEIEPGEVQKLKVKGEAFEKGHYTITILVYEKIPVGDMPGPYASSICRLKVKSRVEKSGEENQNQ
jgi:hypothetical protein